MRWVSLLAATLCAASVCAPLRAEETTSITMDVLFQTCTTDGFGTSCFFYGRDRGFVTDEGFGTDLDLMAQLADVPINTPLQITGELLGDRGAGAMSRLLLNGFVPGPEDPYANLRAQLQGDWTWSDDSNYGLTVTGSEWQSLFAGQKAGMLMLQIASACPSAAASTAPVVVLRGYDSVPDETMCLRIDEIDADRMLVYQFSTEVYAEWRRP